VGKNTVHRFKSSKDHESEEQDEDEKPVYGFKLPRADGVSDGFFINL
jgi:hypothetical protein